MPELTTISSSPSGRRSRLRKMSSIRSDGDVGADTFWGIELSLDNPEEVWSVKEEPDEDDEDADEGPDRDFMLHQLYIRMAALGKGIPKQEEQIVEVETADKDGKVIKIPILNMVNGVNNMASLNMDFPDKHKVIFRLIEGSGPVYLTGTCIQYYPQLDFDSHEESVYTETETTASDEDEVEDESDDEEEEEEEEEEPKRKGKSGVKRKSTSKASKAKQRSKLDSKEESEEASEEQEEEDEDEDDEEEMDTGSKKKKGRASISPKSGASKSPKAGKAVKKGTAAGKVDKKKGKKLIKGK